MVDKYSISSIKLDKIPSNNNQFLNKINENLEERFLNVKSIDITSRLGQFAWRQIIPSTISLPVIFRHHRREEYLCVQMINIHLLSKYSSDLISFCTRQFPIEYFSLTEYEAKLFQYINKFHSNGSLAKNNQLNYSQIDLIFITPFIAFLQFYQFLSFNSQTISNNQSYMSYKFIKPNPERRKESVNEKCLSDKEVSSSSDISKSTNSYRRSITFHNKEIKSYSTTSSIDSNETILCLSVQDIISTYFPLTTLEEFIQLCRIKQIIRYKPDKSTHSDLSLRLINIRQLEEYWKFFNQQLLTNKQSTSSSSSSSNKEKVFQSDSLLLTNDNNQLEVSTNIIEQSLENTSKMSQSTLEKNSFSQTDIIPSIDNQINIQIEEQIDIIQQQQENVIEKNKEDDEMINDLSENKQKKTNLKKKRRRSQRYFFTFKRRKSKQEKDIEWWIKKYSIEPISIFLQRTNLHIE